MGDEATERQKQNFQNGKTYILRNRINDLVYWKQMPEFIAKNGSTQKRHECQEMSKMETIPNDEGMT